MSKIIHPSNNKPQILVGNTTLQRNILVGPYNCDSPLKMLPFYHRRRDVVIILDWNGEPGRTTVTTEVSDLAVVWVPRSGGGAPEKHFHICLLHAKSPECDWLHPFYLHRFVSWPTRCPRLRCIAVRIEFKDCDPTDRITCMFVSL